MKLDKKIIDYIENSDAYFIVAVKGNENATSCQAKNESAMTATELIAAALLSSIKKAIDEKETVNIMPILVTISKAVKLFPELINVKIEYD